MSFKKIVELVSGKIYITPLRDREEAGKKRGEKRNEEKPIMLLTPEDKSRSPKRIQHRYYLPCQHSSNRSC